jgi:hypothetical protein
MNEPLTALERELLNYVEQLVAASESSALQLRDLELRSTGQIGQKLDCLLDCVTLLLKSQDMLAGALKGLLNASENYAMLEQRMDESLRQTKDAERRLSGN